MTDMNVTAHEEYMDEASLRIDLEMRERVSIKKVFGMHTHKRNCALAKHNFQKKKLNTKIALIKRCRSLMRNPSKNLDEFHKLVNAGVMEEKVQLEVLQERLKHEDTRIQEELEALEQELKSNLLAVCRKHTACFLLYAMRRLEALSGNILFVDKDVEYIFSPYAFLLYAWRRVMGMSVPEYARVLTDDVIVESVCLIDKYGPFYLIPN